MSQDVDEILETKSEKSEADTQTDAGSNGAKVLSGFFWVLTIIGAIIGALFVMVSLVEAEGAPQEAAAAAIGVAFVVIPYCIARAISELGG